MNVIFDRLAKEELTDAIEYYEIEMNGLGVRFKEETKRVLRIIKKMPEIGSPESENVRRYILHNFPYKIIYSIEKDHIYVIAVAHMHREPKYWIDRSK
jgi:plasmid stabilization system protein ParE